ncbi:acyltransferase-like protein At3g26840, chloroplastic isoform X1 [Ananas comosus]|uniref:Acyltransferase-like protein At3g26840, chloroplastic isoform X1 n=2 Tax=Ananas comosus TaxID=4615 RepID=A0A6P5EYW5_ANACO|nr:acyltransferase-like protein At3g26840, chloroplastic isoform X1 [Ananas comosus]
MNGSPLLLFLPGIDGVGVGLIRHHERLGKIFDIWCLHIPVMDRTPFEDLIEYVERTVKSEKLKSPEKPIYLVGESIGACLALAVAARNPEIDLILILANPATSFPNSQLQSLSAFLDAVPEPLHVTIPYFFSLLGGNSMRMTSSYVGGDLSLEEAIRTFSESLNDALPFLSFLVEVLPKESLLWKLRMLRLASSFVNSRLHAVKAETLILASGRDELLPSREEAERLSGTLPNCRIRHFKDNGHTIFLEGGIDLVTIIKGAGYYRRSRQINYVSDYLLPTPNELQKVIEEYRLINFASSPVMLSTLEDGKIVKGLEGIPNKGPTILVGYHMLLGLELGPLATTFLNERGILLRGIAHPFMFNRTSEKLMPDSASFDRYRIMGAVPVSATNLYRLLSQKCFVLLYPGGAREALHRKGEQYKLFWPKQSEFVRMASSFGATIIPFGVIGEDDICELLLDYDDLVKVPFYDILDKRINEAAVRVRADFNGEVGNQDLYAPGLLPKIPGRFYFLFGKPIETRGRKQELRDKAKAQELYMDVKCEVERCLAYLQEKREKDPYRNIFPRTLFQLINGFNVEVPTFDL